MGKRNRKTADVMQAVPQGDEGLDALMQSISGVPLDVTPDSEPAPVQSLEEIIEGLEVANEGEVTEEQPAAAEGAGEPALAESTEPVVEQPAAEVTEAPTETPEAKKARLKTEREAKKAERDAKRAAERAANPVPKKVFFGKNNLGRMTALMGEEKLRENMVTTVTDATLEGEALKAKIDENLDAFKGLSVKVQRRSTYIIEFAHKGVADPSKLNEVVRRAFTVLHRDGFVETGEKGNLAVDMLAKPYDIATVRTAGMNSLNAMKALAIIVPHAEKKQTYVLNPDSLLGAKVNALLGLK